MSFEPLTHHEIIALIEPFVRRGYHVDLAATNRQKRRIVFKPIEHAATPDRPKITEELQLDNIPSTTFKLSRSLTLASGPKAVLLATGGSPKDLFERISSVPLERAFPSHPRAAIAESHGIEVSGSVFMDIERMTLASAAADAGGLSVRLNMPGVSGYPASMELTPADGTITGLPDDLLAVLGRDFGILTETTKGWKIQVRMGGREPDRSRRAEAKFKDAIAHIAETLSQPPARFHDNHRRARLFAALRRTLPLVTCAVLLALAASISKLGIDPNSSLQMLLFNIPGLLLLIVFGMRELPRLEIPRLPKPLRANSWHAAEGATGKDRSIMQNQAAE